MFLNFGILKLSRLHSSCSFIELFKLDIPKRGVFAFICTFLGFNTFDGWGDSPLLSDNLLKLKFNFLKYLKAILYFYFTMFYLWFLNVTFFNLLIGDLVWGLLFSESKILMFSDSLLITNLGESYALIVVCFLNIFFLMLLLFIDSSLFWHFIGVTFNNELCLLCTGLGDAHELLSKYYCHKNNFSRYLPLSLVHNYSTFLQ